MGSTFKDLIRGAVPLARVIFDDPRKRRLIPQLQRDGWPIFEIAGSHARFLPISPPICVRRRRADRHRAAGKPSAPAAARPPPAPTSPSRPPPQRQTPPNDGRRRRFLS